MNSFQRWACSLTAGCVLLAGSANLRAADPEEAQYNVVVTLYNAGQWQAAVNKIEEREKLTLPDPMKSKYLYAKGLAYEKGEKSDLARETYKRLLEKFPAAAEVEPAKVSLLYLDYAAGKSDDVIAGYAKLDQGKLAAGDKKNISLMYAESLYAKKPDKAALDAYKAALALGADANSVSAKLFDLYIRLGMHAEAVQQSAAAIPGVKPEMQALIRAESLLALSRWAEAETEAAKVPQGNELFARASFARAQALIKQNKLKEAVAPLEAAIGGMKDPAAPPAAHLALAECLLESDRAADAVKAMDQADKAIKNAPEDLKPKLQGQASLLRVRASMGGKDRKGTIKAISESRDRVPKEQLPKLLYMRLFALSEEGDNKAILATMKDDYPLFQAGEEYGPATLIYTTALQKASRGEEASKLLEEFIAKKPDSPEALRARLQLAQAALDKQDYAKAKPLFDAIATAAGASDKLGKNAFDELQFNRGVIAQKLNDQPAAIAAFTALVAAKPSDEITKQTLPLLGQAYAVQKDYANAAATWKSALAANSPDEADLRDRLARVLFAAKDYAGVVEQIAAEAKLLGGEGKLARESREIRARSLFTAGKFDDAAAGYVSLAESFRDSPGYYYEAAVASERAKKPADAEKYYTLARNKKDKLPADYAAAVDGNLAALRLSAGVGDMGLSDWLTKLENAKDDAAFEAAAASLRKIAAAGKIDATGRARLTKLLDATPATSAHRYTIGALAAHSLLAEQKPRDAAAIASKLVAQFAENEKSLDVKSSGATLAPAVLYYAKAEGERAGENFADALASYETVLSVYPVNEWPDAAACGQAECYAALGDKETAIAKFKEVTDAQPPAPASAKWRELATKRIAELGQPK